jgi:hypothetical protein
VAVGELGEGVSRPVYEAPVLTVLGTVNVLTYDIPKKYGPSDGFTFNDATITDASV